LEDIVQEPKTKDYLTGFYHRETLNPFLGDLLLGAKSKKAPFSMAVLDLDHFKRYNDRYGHSFGDMILKYFASTLRTSLEGENCYIFRYGGDEFVALFPDKDPDGTYKALKHCCAGLSGRPFSFEKKTFKITISCGIAGYPQDGSEMWELFDRADAALYVSKHHGRNYITRAGKIGFVKFTTKFSQVMGATVFVLLVLASFHYLIRPNAGQIDRIMGWKIPKGKVKTTPASKNLDALIMKDGNVLEGRILEETDEKVVFSLHLDEGLGSFTVDKKDIKSIQYRAK